MSNALAIAAVTAVLRDLLNNGVIKHDLTATTGVVQVTSRAPDLITTGPNEPPQLNLFLYQVTPNQSWRNEDLPSRDSTGNRVSNPPLALDLHYLLTAYGSEDFVAEILLGYAMQILHETPVLTREAIRIALAGQSPVTGIVLPPALQALAAATLADQAEMIKIVSEFLNTEELSKLWTAFQSHYRATAAYKVSVILIQSTCPTRSTLPVLTRRVYGLPLTRPIITQVTSAVMPPADPRITTDTTLQIHGMGLKGPITRVRLGDTFVPDAALTLSDSLISFSLPADNGLRSGVQSVQVVHQILLGEQGSETPHDVIESNVAAFVLHPKIELRSQSVHADAGGLTVGFKPPVGKSQRVMLSLYEVNAPDSRPARAYSFPAPRNSGVIGAFTETSNIRFSFEDVEPGDYLVYVQVDGAESILDLDPRTGQFAAPKVKIE